MRNDNIQYARGLAAVMIILFHEVNQISRLGTAIPGEYFEWLCTGVDIFFVISGLVMGMTSQMGHNTRPALFMKRRLVRIVPLYWTISFVLILFSVFAPKLLQSVRFDPWLVLASLAFIPWPNPSTNDLSPMLIVGWTLNYEMFFYVIYAACLYATGSARLLILTVILGGLALAGSLLPDQNRWIAFYANHHALEFLFGVLIATYAKPSSRRVSALGWACIGLTSFVGLGLSFPLLRPLGWNGAAWTILSALVVLALFKQPSREPAGTWRFAPVRRFAGAVGNASYSIYLSHPLVLSAVGQIFQKTALRHVPHFEFLFVAVATAAAISVGLAVHVGVEIPLIRLAKQKLMPAGSRDDHAQIPASEGDGQGSHRMAALGR